MEITNWWRSNSWFPADFVLFNENPINFLRRLPPVIFATVSGQLKSNLHPEWRKFRAQSIAGIVAGVLRNLAFVKYACKSCERTSFGLGNGGRRGEDCFGSSKEILLPFKRVAFSLFLVGFSDCAPMWSQWRIFCLLCALSEWIGIFFCGLWVE